MSIWTSSQYWDDLQILHAYIFLLSSYAFLLHASNPLCLKACTSRGSVCKLQKGVCGEHITQPCRLSFWKHAMLLQDANMAYTQN